MSKFELLSDEDAPTGDVVVPALGNKIVRIGDVVDFPAEFDDALLEQPKTWKPSGWTPKPADDSTAAPLELADGQPPPPLGVADPVETVDEAFAVPKEDTPPPPAAKPDPAPSNPPAAETTQASA